MDPMLLILILGGGAVVVLLVVGIVVTARSERSLVEERLGRYLEEEQVKEKKAEKASPVGDWLNSRLERSTWGGGIARELARADLKLKPGEYVIVMFLSGIGTAVVFWYLMGRGTAFPIPIFPILGFIVGLFLPRVYVRRQQSQRLVRFGDQLADMLNLMVNGLRAGYSTMQAMEAVSREMPSPISDEFRRVVGDLDLVITAMNVQREVGGNLAEILDTISYTIRERVRIKGEIRVLTSQVLYSGRFLAMMPLMIAGVLWVVNRPYMMQFFTEPKIVGYISLTIAAILVLSGYFVMTRIANIDV